MISLNNPYLKLQSSQTEFSPNLLKMWSIDPLYIKLRPQNLSFKGSFGKKEGLLLYKQGVRENPALKDSTTTGAIKQAQQLIS